MAFLYWLRAVHRKSNKQVFPSRGSIDPRRRTENNAFSEPNSWPKWGADMRLNRQPSDVNGYKGFEFRSAVDEQGNLKYYATLVDHYRFTKKHFRYLHRLWRKIHTKGFIWEWLTVLAEYMQYGDPDTEFEPKLYTLAKPVR
jgi:hypothetical protein